MYIQERNSSPILLTKLTNVGRKAIAQGNMNFTYYSIGDSEIDYKSNSILKLIKNKDNHPKQVSFLEKGDCVRYFPITEEMENVVQLTLRNNARDRGFFDKCIVDTAKLNSELFKTEGSFRLSLLDGTKILDLTGIILEEQFNAINDNDVIMMKIPNLLGVSEVNVNDTIFPLNTLYFALTKTNLSGRFEVDRFLPYFSDYDGSDDLIVNYWIIPSKENALSYYSPSGQTINWNSETLEFFEECYSGDTLVWNMNMPYCNNIIGATGCTTDIDNYGSQGYESTLHYLSLCNECPELSGDKCSDQLESSEYYFNNKTILHFLSQARLLM
jgi:hypothetical protein